MSVSESPENGQLLPPMDALAASFAARKYSVCGQPWLYAEVAKRMASRLPLIKHDTRHWVLWAPRTGGLDSLPLVLSHCPKAAVTVLESDPQDLRWAQTALEPPWWQFWKRPTLNFRSKVASPADMVWSHMQLHQCADPMQLMTDWNQSLNEQGYVMFSCLGPDSLKELRAVYEQQGWPAPHHAFTDMHDWGDMLLKSGFTQPIMDMERITLTYASADPLIADLRTLGRNLHPQRFAFLRGKAWRGRLVEALNEKLSVSKCTDRLTLTFEVIYGHAFKAKTATGRQSETVISLNDMKSMLGGDRTVPSKA